MVKRRVPLVSVLLPVHNGEKFISSSIESILNQTYPNIELIIINDGSEDKTEKIAKSYQLLNPQKIKLINLKKNIGESAAANIGFHQAKGVFIARMDADDISYPQRLEKQVNFLIKNSRVVVVGTQADVINSSGGIIGQKKFPYEHKKIYKLYGYCHPMLHPSCVFNRKLLPEGDRLYENSHEPNDDYFTLFSLLQYGQFANLPEKLMAYRIHGRNKSLQNAKSKIFNAMKVRIDAILNLNYKISFFALFINLVQLLGVMVIPERLIVPLYMFIRGMVNKDSFRVNKKSFLKFRLLPLSH